MVELTIVIVIIALLAGLGIISYSGAQKTSRDAKRKADVNTFAMAMTLYKVDKKTFAFDTVTPPTNAGNTTGEGFVNKAYTTVDPLKVSIASYLSSSGYLSGRLEDPKYDASQCTVAADNYLTCGDYVYFYDLAAKAGTIYAKLENPKYGGDNDMTDATACAGCAKFGTVKNKYQFAKIIK